MNELDSGICITGATGFVGINLIKYLEDHNNSSIRPVDLKITVKEIILPTDTLVIHLAGKAHDLKNVSKPSEYYEINYNLTKFLFDEFIKSDAKKFIFISSVKAVADHMDTLLTEDHQADPKTHYGKSKLIAEEYIQNQILTEGKSYYILRPCMIHGPGNKGNLNLLYSLVSKGLPWPLGSFINSRSYLSIENLCFIIKKLIDREDIPSGVYNVADDVPLSTNEVIKMIAESRGKKERILNLSKNLIKVLARVGDLLKLPLNSERLQKLTESYVVSNAKIKEALGKQLPVSSKEGLMRTFQSFADNA